MYKKYVIYSNVVVLIKILSMYSMYTTILIRELEMGPVLEIHCENKQMILLGWG